MKSKTPWLAIYSLSAFLLLTAGCATHSSRCRVLPDGTFAGRCAELIAKSKHQSSRFSSANVTIADGVGTRPESDLIRGAAPATPSPPAANHGAASLSPEQCNGVDDDGDGLIDEWDNDSNPACRVPVPKGEFYRGCYAETDTRCRPDEMGGANVYVPSFSIDRTEVSGAAYYACVHANRCTAPARPVVKPNEMDLPVSYVTWAQAQSYCNFVGGRLPTETEWEKAARGTAAAVYPWGDEWPTCLMANFGDCGGVPQPAASGVKAASFYGAFHMAGNVAEWVDGWHPFMSYADEAENAGRKPPMRTAKGIRGGSFLSAVVELRSAARGFADPESAFADVGFRCVVANGE
ncbi:MAG: formylglycine-generating enzyme family protein [Myxococcales bacterium]|nr:formylglycine-generating enzyme family protein [Myxococcales bacterium]